LKYWGIYLDKVGPYMVEITNGNLPEYAN